VWEAVEARILQDYLAVQAKKGCRIRIVARVEDPYSKNFTNIDGGVLGCCLCVCGRQETWCCSCMTSVYEREYYTTLLSLCGVTDPTVSCSPTNLCMTSV
jgi:hypothetical protein